MKYLVTGGSGFIGSHLVEQLLKNGHFVINVDNFDDFYPYEIKIQNTWASLQKKASFSTTGNKAQDLEKLAIETQSSHYQLYLCDIRNSDGLRRVFEEHQFDMMIHLAALAGVRPSIERPMDYQAVNIQGSMNLWELCKEFNLKKTICASSSSVYGNNEKTPFSETDNVDYPISHYAATKKCGEIMGHVYHHLYEINMIHLRFFTVYGPRQRPDLAIHKFTKLIQNQQEIPFYGDGSTARDYTFIEDILDGILKSIDYLHKNPKVFEIINLGESEVITLSEMLSELEKFNAKKALIKKLPLQAGDVQKTNADIQKAKILLGYQPKINFQNGIKIFVEWFLRRKL